MAYYEGIAERVREVLADRHDVAEKKMFGGLAFMVGGHMCCGVVGDDLMVRVGAEGHEAALAEPEARAMDFTGRPMMGFVFVSAEGVAEDDALARWIGRGVDHAASLPPK